MKSGIIPLFHYSSLNSTDRSVIAKIDMREAVLVSTARTLLAKSFRGSLNMTRPDDMVAHCLTHCLEKVPGLDPEEIEDIVIGCATPEGTQ